MQTIDFTGADAKSTTELQAALDDFEAQWPGVAPTSVKVVRAFTPERGWAPDDSTYAMTNSETGQIELALRWVSDHREWENDFANAIHNGVFHHTLRKSRPAYYTLMHELGHHLANTVLGRFDYKDTSGEENFKEAVVVALKASGANLDEDDHDMSDMVPVLWNLGYQEALADDLSLYATTSPHEMVAEGFAIRTTLGAGLSKPADAIYDSLARAYTGWVAR